MGRFSGVFRPFSTYGRQLFNHYDVLGVKSSASAGEIKMAYYEKTKLYHPDKVGSTEENLKKFRKISEAYEVLGNNISRKTYDEEVLDITSHVVIEEEEDLANKSLHFRRTDNLQEFTQKIYSELRMEQRVNHKVKQKVVEDIKSAKTAAAELFHTVALISLVSIAILVYEVGPQVWKMLIS